MVYFLSSISVCSSIDQLTNLMANSLSSNELCSKPRHGSQVRKPRKGINVSNCSSVPICDGSRSAVIDVVISIAVIVSCGFLLFPCISFITLYLVEFGGAFCDDVKDEIMNNPLVYGSIAMGTFCSAIATWIVIMCMTRKCGNPNCKGLRNAKEFDIQLETEDSVKNSNGVLVKDVVKRGLFELPRDRHRELETELKKMAPPNGRVVLIFQARCGCSVGRLEVPGPKKTKKIKK